METGKRREGKGPEFASNDNKSTFESSVCCFFFFDFSVFHLFLVLVSALAHKSLVQTKDYVYRHCSIYNNTTLLHIQKETLMSSLN